MTRRRAPKAPYSGGTGPRRHRAVPPASRPGAPCTTRPPRRTTAPAPCSAWTPSRPRDARRRTALPGLRRRPLGCCPVREIHAEPAAAASPRGRQVLARFPDARVVEVDSHWGIPGLHGNEGNVERWVRVKGETLVLGERKTLATAPTAAPRTGSRPAPPTAAPWPAPTATCRAARGTPTRSPSSPTSTGSSPTSAGTSPGRDPSASRTSATPTPGSMTSVRTATARWTP